MLSTTIQVTFKKLMATPMGQECVTAKALSERHEALPESTVQGARRETRRRCSGDMSHGEEGHLTDDQDFRITESERPRALLGQSSHYLPVYWIFIHT